MVSAVVNPLVRHQSLYLNNSAIVPSMTSSNPTDLFRCAWCLPDPLYIDYHDHEWGIPVHDDQKLFEMLILEGAQAGLSWYTILKKRENYRQAFDYFDAKKITNYDDTKVASLLQNPGIVRNKLKVNGAVKNARAYLEVQSAYGSFDQYIWQFTEGQTIVNHPQQLSDVPVTTSVSDAMSRDLKKRGFTFVGSTICYAFMQAVGMVDDHVMACWCKSR